MTVTDHVSCHLRLATICFAGALLMGGPACMTGQQAGVSPGSALAKGMRLVYGSGGSEQPPWVVDSLDLAPSWQDLKPCSYIRFGASDIRRLCVQRDTLFTWNEAQARLIATRPVGARMSMRMTTSSGGQALYETTDFADAAVSGNSYRFLPTTVTTFDASGRVVRRLRERYVLALATALDGVFEVPDTSATGRWVIQREFGLVRIER
ncbi:MAG: hypothetical protein ACRENP_21640 [Longimicrobiales bacterium]